MTVKVLVLNPPYFRQSYNRVARWDGVSISKTIWYPIYLAYCTGLLEKYGHDVRLIDGVADKLSLKEVLVETKHFSPDLAVINYSTLSMDIDLATAEGVKNCSGSYTVLVGPCCSINPEETLLISNKVDGLIRREFDYAVLELANGLPENRIKNLSWKRSGKIIHNIERPPVSSDQLNEFPFVTDVYNRHLKIRNYHQAAQLHPFVDLFTGRSCSWGKCTFCLWPYTINKGAPYRTRNMDNVIEELRFIDESLPFIREIYIQDDTLPAWRARELSSAIIKDGLDLTWSCYTRSDATMDYNTLQLMKNAGCRALHVGYESTNPQILKNVRKGTTVKLMEAFTDAANKAGLMIHADFILGLPGETVETIKKTIAWAKKLEVDSYQFIVPKPYPNTPLYDWLVKEKCLDENGQVNYPGLSYEELGKWTRTAMKECFFRWGYIKRVLSNPKEIGRVISVGLRTIPHILSD